MIKRLALIMYLLIPIIACIGVYADLLPAGPLLDQPYALPVFIIVFGITIVLTIWQIDRRETSGQDKIDYTPIQQVNLIRHYAVIGGVGAFLGLGIAIVLMGQVPLRYLLGGLCGGLGTLVWLAGHSRELQLQKVQSEDVNIGKEAVENLVRQYKPYYVDLRTLMMLSYFISGVGVAGFYLFSGGQYISLWDLGGVLFFLVSSSLWDYRVGKRVEAILKSREDDHEKM